MKAKINSPEPPEQNQTMDKSKETVKSKESIAENKQTEFDSKDKIF